MTSFARWKALLKDWLAGARLREILHVMQLTKAEFARRGITLMGSLDQLGSEQCAKRHPPD
jgi:hypothetical protein